ncbi:trypsin-like serine peptidase [Pseudomonas sp. 5P_3.1_Bac2]|uniref:trypsin-like serine peptidase n=1 Tax=Pseudomonas sp. 5P_3.1_Bac2 TaxID=2971617 RepID=UPI0021C743C6|nr:serine protease [Pseudomonas sp. 5P_3.1_Bac2]MCU1717057.1 serine protease [Pseudomonas sp. 5P_3.1_Bac2]
MSYCIDRIRVAHKYLSYSVLALALTQAQALAAEQIELPQKVTTTYGQFIVEPHSRSQISKHYIEHKGAISLTLKFDSVELPDGAYVEIIDDSGTSQIFSSVQDLEYGVTIRGENATIQVLSNGLQSASLRLSNVTYQPGPARRQSRTILGTDNRRDLECYANTPFYTPALAAVMVINNGSGSLVGNGRYALTNAHVTPSLGADGGPTPLDNEVRLGWFNSTCDAPVALNRQSTISLRTTRLLVRGNPASSTDYALLELDTFDVEHSHALDVFGSLKISEKTPQQPGTAIYIPQYGNGGLRPMMIAAENDAGLKTTIVAINAQNFQLSHDADTQSGSSGSPVIEQESSQIVGLHWGSSIPNVAVGLPVLQQQITPLLGSNNISVPGEGKFKGYNLASAPYLQPITQVDIPSGGRIEAYTDLDLEHLSNYSNVRIAVKNPVSKSIDHQLLQLSIKDDSGIHDLSTPAADNAKLLVNFPEPIQSSAPQTHRGWLPLRINDELGRRVQNLIVALSVTSYNPFQSPFDGVNTITVNLDIPDAGKKASVSKLMTGQQYGYVATYLLQGPNTTGSPAIGSSALITVPLRDSLGNVQVVKLRGYRRTACNTRAMNASVGCASTPLQSTLVVEYLPEDNTDLPPETYSGILPVNAIAETESREILVNITLVKP